MTNIPSEVEFGRGNLERAVSRHEIGFVPFVERVTDHPQPLSALLRAAHEHPLDELATVELEELIRYTGDPAGHVPPLLVLLARESGQSIGALAAATRRDVTNVELGLRALEDFGIVISSMVNGVVRYSLRDDLRTTNDS